MGYGDFERYRSATKHASGLQFAGVLEAAMYSIILLHVSAALQPKLSSVEWGCCNI